MGARLIGALIIGPLLLGHILIGALLIGRKEDTQVQPHARSRARRPMRGGVRRPEKCISCKEAAHLSQHEDLKLGRTRHRLALRVEFNAIWKKKKELITNVQTLVQQSSMDSFQAVSPPECGPGSFSQSGWAQTIKHGCRIPTESLRCPTSCRMHCYARGHLQFLLPSVDHPASDVQTIHLNLHKVGDSLDPL